MRQKIRIATETNQLWLLGFRDVKETCVRIYIQSSIVLKKSCWRTLLTVCAVHSKIVELFMRTLTVLSALRKGNRSERNREQWNMWETTAEESLREFCEKLRYMTLSQKYHFCRFSLYRLLNIESRALKLFAIFL